MTVDYSKRGNVIWLSSEEDGGPDVGIIVGLGGTKSLWVGESSTGRLGWEIAIDDGDTRTQIATLAEGLETPEAVSFAEAIAAAINGE